MGVISHDFLEQRGFWLFYVALGALFTLPLLLVFHPPAMDLPGHLALAQVLASRHTPHDPYSGLFSLPSWPSPNTLYYYLVGGLARLVPIELASKLLLCLGLLGTPLSLAAARRANGEGRALALVGFPLALTFNFVAGFVGFVLALPLMIWLGALARAQVTTPRWGRATLMAIVGVLIYLCHAQVFLFAVGLVGLTALCGALSSLPSKATSPDPDHTGAFSRRSALLGGLRRLLITTAPLLVPILMAVPWYIDRVRLLQRSGGMDMRYPGLKHNLSFLPIHTFDQLAGDLDVWLGLLVVGGMSALAVLALLPAYRARRRRTLAPPQVPSTGESCAAGVEPGLDGGQAALALDAEHGGRTPTLGRRFLMWLGRSAYLLASLSAAITYFTLPAHIRFQAVINGRQAVVALLLLAAAIRVPRGRLPTTVLLFTLMVGGAYGVHYASATFQLNQELAGFRALLALARPHSRLVDPHRPRSQVFRMDVLRHVGSYHVVWNQGLVADTFARWPVQPIRTTRFFHMPGFSPHRPDPYHYVLSGRPLRAPRLALLGKAGPYHLYEVRPARSPRPKPPRPRPPRS